jgi:hypothetical protein
MGPASSLTEAVTSRNITPEPSGAPRTIQPQITRTGTTREVGREASVSRIAVIQMPPRFGGDAATPVVDETA